MCAVSRFNPKGQRSRSQQAILKNLYILPNFNKGFFIDSGKEIGKCSSNNDSIKIALEALNCKQNYEMNNQKHDKGIQEFVLKYNNNKRICK